jgi:hypothetical protein
MKHRVPPLSRLAFDKLIYRDDQPYKWHKGRDFEGK